MREHIDSWHKESENPAAYPEHGTANFNNIANITIDSDSINPKNKRNGKEGKIQKDCEIPSEKTRKIRVQKQAKQLYQMRTKQLCQT